ncbi:hypothetical protein BaRGS_00004086 [Batillaria attramentaria]|uniref:procollagen-proline 4-dioxygenase n=1 Tax=Batillaria attramentaria TaxID=370345 RepID=A0ABD0LZE8_9CAEN
MSARQRNRRGVFGTLLASLVLVLTMTSPAVADVFTASHKIAELAGIEGQLLDTLRNFINEEYDQLKALSQFLLERSKEYRLSLESRPPESQSQILKHPNAAYQLIKWYVKTWTRRMDNSPCFKSRLKSEVTSLVPVFKDFEGALSALVRLHHIYRLNASDMYDGNYLGYQGPRLEPDDAFEVGRQAFVDGLPQESRQWLELAADKMREDWRKQKEEGQGKTARPRAQQVTRSLAWTLALLGRAYYVVSSWHNVPNLPEVNALKEDLEGASEIKYTHDNKSHYSNLSELCSRDKEHRVSEIRPYHVCRYKPALHSPYLQYKEEILSQEPYVSVFYDVVNDTEIDTIKHRFVDDDELPAAAAVSKKVKAITRLEVKYLRAKRPFSAEPLQVVNYGLGGHYDAHKDAMELSDVEKGGQTVFTQAGISVAPLKGMALFWYNYEPDMSQTQELTTHAGCPVVYGHKWIATKWIWTYGNTFRRPCGMSPNATQLDIERLVQSRDWARSWDELTEYCGEELYVYSSAVLKVNGYYSDETCSVDIRASHAEYKNEVRLELMSLQANCQRNWIQLHANNAPLSNKLCGLENALTMYVTYPSDTLTVTIGTNKWGSEITSRMLATSTSTWHSNGDFICGNGMYVDESLQCDGYNNCGDWSDEDSDLCGTDVARRATMIKPGYAYGPPPYGAINNGYMPPPPPYNAMPDVTMPPPPAPQPARAATEAASEPATATTVSNTNSTSTAASDNSGATGVTPEAV